MDHRCLLALAAAIVALATPATGEPWSRCGKTNNNFLANSAFQENLNRITASLPRNISASRDLYATSVAGTVPEQVWAMGLCRGDANATTCFTCLARASGDVQVHCAYNKEATMYYDSCMLHYSDVHTLPSDDTGPTTDAFGLINFEKIASDPARFNHLLAALLNATADYAAFNSTRRFATGEADLNQEFAKVYTLAQCLPDQPPVQCRKCLAGIIASYLPTMQSRIGGRVIWVNCIYRFEVGSFYNGPAMVHLTASSAGGPVPEPAPLPPPPPSPAFERGQLRPEEVM